MSEFDTLKSVVMGDTLAGADRLAWVRAGIAALDARTSADKKPPTAEERAMLVTLLLSLEEALAKIDAESEKGDAGALPRADLPVVVALKSQLAEIGGRLRTRVVYSTERKPRSPVLRVVPWVRLRSGRPGSRLLLVGQWLSAFGVTIAAFLIFEFTLSGLVHARAQQDLLVSFKQQIQTTTLDTSSMVQADGGPVALLHIPRIGLDEVVVEGSTPDDLKKGPGHLRTAPLPGEFGNAVIAGRRTTYGAPFRDLDRLRIGDSIRVTTGQGVFYYIIEDVRHVSAGRADALTATLDTRLTLITSDPAFVPSGRLVVVASWRPPLRPATSAARRLTWPRAVRHRQRSPSSG